MAPPVHAAGVILTAPDGCVLFLKRGEAGDHVGEWCLPGGGIEDGETPEEAARREAEEETGFSPQEGLQEVHVQDGPEVHFTTLSGSVDKHYTPRLNEEHVAYAWARPEHAPEPLHPGVRAMLGALAASVAEDECDMTDGGSDGCALALDYMPSDSVFGGRKGVAFDRANVTVRRTDEDGRLHVSVTNISKANVCPYLGREIPGFVELGLDPNKVYKLYRDPDELAKGAATFNNLPLLSRHVEVSAQDHQPELVVGSTGTDAEFAAPYLRNSLVVWAKPSIDLIEADEQKELSSAYRYRADMTPGTVDGVDYDGVMRDIVGNHVALVKEGRAGSDVVVGDSTEELNNMAIKLTHKAAMVRGAALAFLMPKLAADAKLNLTPVLAGVNAKNYASKIPSIFEGIKKQLPPKIAADSSEGLKELLGALEKEPLEDGGDPLDDITTQDAGDPPPFVEKKEVEEPAPPVEPEAKDANPIDAIKAFLKGKLSDEDMNEIERMALAGGSADAEPEKEEEKKDVVTKAAMDEAIKKAQKTAFDEAAKVQREIRVATAEARKYVGDLPAFDSAETAEQVYRMALDAMSVEGIKDVHASALPVILRQQPLPGAKRDNAPAHVAMDAAGVKGFNDRFPDANRIKLM